MGTSKSAEAAGDAHRHAVPDQVQGQAERYLDALLEVVALSEADSLPSALPGVLRRICDAARWDVGHYWALDEDGSLCRVASTSRGAEGGSCILSESGRCPPWLANDPVWIADLPTDARTPVAAAAWHSALLVPVRSGTTRVGVLELYSVRPATPDPDVLRVLRGAATQIGHLHAGAAALERLKEGEERFASTMDLAAIGMSHIDGHGRFISANPKLCSMLGYSEQELLERTIKDVSHPLDRDVTDDLVRQLRSGAVSSFKCEKRYLHKGGAQIWVSLNVAAKRDRNGTMLYHVSIVEDISARKDAEERVRYLASHDPLTNLPNRSTFAELLSVASETARRYGRRLAVLFVDLDRFKAINDSLGHEAGDVMLREVALRLRGCVRASDVVGRLGGDEFVVLLNEISEPADAAGIARDIVETLRRPVVIMGQPCAVSASVGVCLHPDGDQDDSAVLKNADMAMYLAKQSGKNGYRVYINEVKTAAVERARLEPQLRGALERREHALRYELRFDAKTNSIAALDVSLIWTRAELRAAAADAVSSVAEEAGLSVAISTRVLRGACTHAAAWARAGAPAVQLAVEVCFAQVTDHDFVATLRDELASHGIEPRRLELGMSEDLLLRNPERVLHALRALKTLGVEIAVAAFGAGRLSFAELKRFPVDVLKIDGARLRGIATDVEQQRELDGIVVLARALGLGVVATGIADLDDAAYLRASGCAAVQGVVYGIARSAGECEALLHRSAR